MYMQTSEQPQIDEIEGKKSMKFWIWILKIH